MSGINYLDGSIYHMAHFDTSKGIFQRRAILCKRGVGQEKIPYGVTFMLRACSNLEFANTIKIG